MRMHSSTSSDKFGQYLFKWYKDKTNSIHINNYFVATAIYKKEKLEGVIIYHNFTPTNVDLHFYMPGCLNRWVISQMFKYPFEELKLQRITGWVNSKLTKLIKTAEFLGFERTGTVKNYYALHEDMLIYSMYPAMANKWIR